MTTPAPIRSDGIWLGGRLTRQSLPRHSAAGGTPPPGPKRLDLPQGTLAQLVDKDAFRYLAWLELRAGKPRGNHFHRRKEESFYLISGEADLHVLDRDNPHPVVLRLVPGDLVRIAPPLAHALLPITDGSALEFSPGGFDPDDTFRHPVLPPPPGTAGA